jgi:hypothetical protein
VKTNKAVINLENAVAISAGFHSDIKKYNRFYEKHADAFEGFPGIWRFIVRASNAFTHAENETKDTWNNHDWISSIDAFVSFLHFRADSYTSDKELLSWARTAIQKN